jgi:folate-binding protein YgfZ
MAPTAQSEITNPAATQLNALLHKAAISPLTETGWIRATGEDRVRWLNGMVTNSIQDLKPGKGSYSFVLSVQGRIQGDAYIFAESDAILLETASAQLPGLMALLDRFIIMDDVELADISATRSGLSIAGPEAASLLAKLGLNVEHLSPLDLQPADWNSTPITIIHAHSSLVPRFELWADAATIAALSQALLAAGAINADPESLEYLRILDGTPLYGKDIRDRELPQETAQTRALHFSKGCYLGQEIVERIRSRGNVHRTFSAFRLEGDLPPAGSTLEAEGKQIGELTSVAAIPLQGNPIQLALGYIRREALDRATPLTYPGGVAIPIAIPFSPSEAPGQSPASESSERA